jgi:hypothetical protein
MSLSEHSQVALDLFVSNADAGALHTDDRARFVQLIVSIFRHDEGHYDQSVIEAQLQGGGFSAERRAEWIARLDDGLELLRAYDGGRVYP